MEKAILDFEEIKKNFLALITFANSCKELEKFVFTKIPEYFEKIEKLFEQAKKNTKSDLAYIGFEVQMLDLKNEYLLLTQSFTIHG
jgi:hypothetical protein